MTAELRGSAAGSGEIQVALADDLQRTERASGQNLFHDSAMHVGQSEIAAGVAVGEAFVVEAHQVQQRGVEIVDVDSVLDGSIAEVIRAAVGQAPFDAAAREPDGEAVMIVIAASGVAAADGNLDSGSPSEFAAAQHERFVE